MPTQQDRISDTRPGRPAMGSFDQAPFIVFWETTRACDLVCRHCRANAVPERDPRDLDSTEAFRLLDEIKAMGCPVVVLTGGDPAKRRDLVDIVRYGASIGLRMALTPSATPLITRELLTELRDAGLARVAVSLDGASAESHDAFRGVAGSYERTFEILRAAREIGLTTQINTSVTTFNHAEIEEIAVQAGKLDIELWSVFFVVPTGRAHADDLLQPIAAEDLLERLADISESSAFDVKTTAAPHFRRVLLQRKVSRSDVRGVSDGIGRAPRGVNDGQGIAFISHLGEVYPSGFMPVPCGNVREESLAKIYREHPLFRSLRDPEALHGKCGVCEFRRICGGSRARSYALTGDPLAEEPSCAYSPGRWTE